ncbi:alkaline phosphatase family protein [Eubacteriales bacterium OttesenSCG-928-A19]|nr:alkaline phosphatase family protein [Eubacteriales bacterium OttesenSCG-928-A19]
MSNKKDTGAMALAAAVQKAYERGESDYFMKPLVRVDAAGQPIGKIRDGDTAIFCCRRGEREIELTEMFTDPAFDKVERTRLDGVEFVILTLYHERFRHLPVAFQPERLEKPLAQIISEAGKTQLHCAESEKYAHVTFFFNGGNSQPYPGEEDIQVPSPRGIDFADKPELSLPEVVDVVSERLGEFDYAVVNFANGDIIGHTSSNQAKIDAAGHISRELGRLVRAAKEKDYVIAITADHGNLEVMTTPEGKPHVAHTRNLVPFMLIDPRHDGPIPVRDGSLSGVAPTVLDIMGLEKPAEMTAESLCGGHDFGDGRKVLLVILDGWGFGAEDGTNPIFLADTPDWDTLVAQHPPSSLHASDGYVGLGDGKAGNSEAGHLNLGAGRVVTQDDVRLDNAIKNNAFSQNEVLKKAVDDAKSRGAALHLLAFLTQNSSHGSIEYALAICRMARALDEVYLHIIFDGRSTPPGSAPELLEALDKELQAIGVGTVVDGVGRGIVLERDRNYDKVKLGYDAMVTGKGTPYS